MRNWGWNFWDRPWERKQRIVFNHFVCAWVRFALGYASCRTVLEAFIVLFVYMLLCKKVICWNWSTELNSMFHNYWYANEMNSALFHRYGNAVVIWLTHVHHSGCQMNGIYCSRGLSEIVKICTANTFYEQNYIWLNIRSLIPGHVATFWLLIEITVQLFRPFIHYVFNLGLKKINIRNFHRGCP